MDRERNRVLVAESLHRAAAAANSGSLDAACTLLADAETQLSASPSMQQHDPLCARLQEVLCAALRRLEDSSAEALVARPEGEAQGVAAGRGAGGGAAELLELGVAGALRRGLGHARPDGALLRALQDSDCVFGLQVR